jgi:hypothetical protein
MPTERQKIEAELQMSEQERIVADLKRLIKDVEEFERDLQAREAELGLPTFYRSKPLVERMALVGMSKEAVEKMNLLFDTLKARAKGDDWPESAKQLLAEVADAEYSAIDQLAAFIESRRKT